MSTDMHEVRCMTWKFSTRWNNYGLALPSINWRWHPKNWSYILK